MSTVLAMPAISIPPPPPAAARSPPAPSIMISPSSSPTFSTADAAQGLATIGRQPPSAQRTRVHVRVACTMCKAAKVRCEGSRPCRYCVKHSLSDKCVDSQQKKRGPKPKAQYKAGKTEAPPEGEIVVVPRASSSSNGSPRSHARAAGRMKSSTVSADAGSSGSLAFTASSAVPLSATMSVSEVAMSPHSGLKHTASRRHHVATRTPSNTSGGAPSTSATVNVTVSASSLPTLNSSTSSTGGSDPSLHFITTDTRSSSPSTVHAYSLLGDMSQQPNGSFLFDPSRPMHSSQLLGNVNLQLQFQHAMQLQQLQLQQQMMQPSSFPMGINMGLPLPMPVMQLGMNGMSSLSMPSVSSTPSTAPSSEAGPSPASAVSTAETIHSSFGAAESGTAASLPASTLGSSTSAAFDSLAQTSSSAAMGLPYNSVMQLPIGLPLSMLPMGSMNPVMRMPLLQDSSLFPFSSASNQLLSSSTSQSGGNMYWPYGMGQPLYYPSVQMTAPSSDPLASLQPSTAPAMPSGVESMLSAAHLLGEVKDAAGHGTSADMAEDTHEHASRKRTRESSSSDGAESAKRAFTAAAPVDTPSAPHPPEHDTMPTPSAPAADIQF